MKKAIKERETAIQFENKDVQAYADDPLRWCADNWSSGCSSPPSTDNCTSCAMKTGCNTAVIKALCGYTAGCADDLTD